MLELVLQQKAVKWDSKHDPVTQRSSSPLTVPHSEQLPAAVQGDGELVKPMF